MTHPLIAELLRDLPTKPTERIQVLAELISVVETELEIAGGGELDSVMGQDARPILLARARTALAESEHRFRTIFNASQDGMLLIDDDGICIDANAAAHELLGMPQAALVGQEAHLYSGNVTSAGSIWRSMQDSGIGRDETVLVTADGVERHVIASAVKDVLPHRHLWVLHDITQRRMAEMQLQDVNARLAQNNQQLTTIHEISMRLMQTLDPHAIYATLAWDFVRGFLGARSCAVALANDTEDAYIFDYAWIDGVEQHVEELTPVAREDVKRFEQRRYPYFMPYEELRLYFPAALRSEPMSDAIGLVVPLMREGAMIGALGIVGERADLPARLDLNLIAIFGNQAAGALVNAKLFGRMQHEIRQRRAAETQRADAINLLQRRVRELTLLHGLAGLFQRDDFSTQSMLQEVVELIPQACIDSARTAVRIEVGDVQVTSTQATSVTWQIEQRFVCNDGTVGRISMGRTNDDKAGDSCEPDAGMRQLLKVVADMLRSNLDLQRADSLLKRNEAHLRSLLDALPAAVAMVDEQGSVVAVNAGWQSFVGNQVLQDAPIGVGENYLALLQDRSRDNADLAEFVRGLSHVLDGSRLRFEYEYPVELPDGQQQWFYLLMAPTVPGAERGAVILHFDVTSRAEAQLALKETLETHESFSAQLAEVLRIGNELWHSGSEDELCRRAVEAGLTRLGFERASIWLVDKELTTMRGTYGTDEAGGVRDERGVHHPLAGSDGIRQIVAEPQRSVFWEERALRDEHHAVVGTGAAGAAALWNGEEVIGLLSVDNLLTGSPFPPYAPRIVELYAATLGHLLAGKRYEQELVAHAKLSSALQSASSRSDVVATILAEVMDVLPVNGVAILLRENGSGPRVVQAAGMLGATVGARLAVAHGATQEEAAANGQSLPDVLNLGTWPDALEADPVWRGLGDEAGSLIHATLRTQHATIGALVVSTPRRLPEAGLRIIQSLAEIAATAIHRSLLYEQIEVQAMRLNRILTTIPFGLLLLDREQRVVLANSEAEAALVQFGKFGHEGELVSLGGKSLETVLTAELEPPAVQELVHGNVTYEIDHAPLNAEGYRDGWLMTLRDVTEDRLAEAAIKQQERLAAVGQLAAGIAHDFNNIIGVILLYVQMLERNKGLDVLDTQRLTIIREQAENAGNLVRQILDFSRQSIVERRELDLRSLVQETAQLWARTLPEHVKIELCFGASSHYLMLGDPTLIQQVLTNLALNSRDAMPNGGSLYVEVDHVHLVQDEALPHAEMEPGEWIRLRVGDTGEGIAPHLLPHIFDPFFTTKEVGKGTGLGLAQVYGIVKQHRGFVDAQSTEGEGSVIEIYFPAHEALPDQAAQEPESEPEFLDGTGTILLVEDNVSAREATTAIFEMLGYRVLTAANGSEGLKWLREHAYEIELIVTDLVMPEMGGAELLRHAQREAPDVKAIIMTGYPREEDEHDLAALRRVEWLQKPFTVKKLKETVLAILR